MLQYVLFEPGRIAEKETAIPEPSGTQVLIRIRYVGICGSDIHLYRGSYSGPHSYPMLLGHEWSGVVEKTGDGVTGFAPGDVVTGDCSRFCGACEACETDANLCAHIEKFGITIDGATAQYILRDQKYLYKAPKGMERELLCLCEPVAVAAHLLRRVRKCLDGDLREKRILVLGGGVIGMSAMMLLRNMHGCEQIDLFDLAASRKEIAAAAGARIPSPQELKPPTGADYASLYAAAVYDVVIETTGVASVFANALYYVKPGGILGCLGMIAKAEIAQKLIVTKALTLIGSIGGTGDFPQAMEFLCTYPETARKLISHYFPMPQAPEAFAVAGNPEGTMKVVLTL